MNDGMGKEWSSSVLYTTDDSTDQVWSDPKMFIPVAVSMTAVFLIVITVFICFKKSERLGLVYLMRRGHPANLSFFLLKYCNKIYLEDHDTCVYFLNFF